MSSGADLDAQLVRDLLHAIDAHIPKCGEADCTTCDTRHEQLAEAITPLVAQREQAAELRGRIDELEDVLGGTAEKDRSEHLNWYVKDRLATLQATKPEKGTEQ